jgi:hypothetical protein
MALACGGDLKRIAATPHCHQHKNQSLPIRKHLSDMALRRSYWSSAPERRSAGASSASHAFSSASQSISLRLAAVATTTTTSSKSESDGRCVWIRMGITMSWYSDLSLDAGHFGIIKSDFQPINRVDSIIDQSNVQ